jgi:DnaJ-class molecular chaperone
MKKILIITMFLFIPFVSIYSQNNNDSNPAKNPEQKIQTFTEVECKDCQGWGWIVSVGLKTETASVAFSGNSGRGIGNTGYTTEISQGRAICPYCRGTGKRIVK